MKPSDVVISGMGAVSALGTGCGALVSALREGRDGLRVTDRFDTTPFVCGMAGTWPFWDGRAQRKTSEVTLAESAAAFPALEMALAAAGEALDVSRLNREVLPSTRVALLLGTCFGQGFTLFHELTEQLGEALGIRGPCLTLSTACSSSNNAIGLGRDLLRHDRADVVLAGGVDVLLREVFAGFNILGVLSSQKCAPWSEPAGTTLAEGAGMVVLERAADASRRGLDALCTIDGYALSADAYHETSPDPRGLGVERAIRWALWDAGVPSASIDHVNAHATGTESNDRTEWQAIVRALERNTVPVSGLKSYLGHAMGAAGVLELIFAVLAMREGLLPATLRFERPRPGAPPDPVPGPRPRLGRVTQALNISAGFGGANSVLVYGSVDRPSAPERASQASPVVVRGIGAVSPLGVGLSVLRAPLADGLPVTGRVGSIPFGTLAPTVDPRRLDPSSRFLIAATATALRDAGITSRGERREGGGLFLGASRMPDESSKTCQDSLTRHGPQGISGAAFARMTVNGPAGSCAKHLGLLGPCTTISIGPGSGLLAIAYAADWLARREDARMLVAGAVDEAPASSTEASGFEGAASIVLERLPDGAGPGDIVIAGWGLTGPGEVAAAVVAAVGHHQAPDGILSDGPAGRECLASLSEKNPALPFGFKNVGPSVSGETCASTLAFAMAVSSLREARARSLLVVASRSRSATVAVHLLRNPG